MPGDAAAKPRLDIGASSVRYELPEVAALVDRLLESNPSHRGAWSERITAALQTGDIGGALALTATALQRWPDDPGFACRHAEALRRAGRFDEARRFLDSLDPERQSALPVRIERAALLRGIGDLAAAAAILERVLADQPGHRSAWAALIEIALASGKGDLAHARADEALSIHPGDVLLASRRAMVLHGAGRSDEALSDLEAIRRAAPEAGPALFVMGNILRDLGRDPDAAAVYDAVLDAWPAHQGAWGARIDLALRSGDIAGALGISETAVNRCPGNAVLLAKRSAVLRRAGRRPDAERLLETFLATDPHNVPALLALAATQREGGAPDRAAALVDRLLESNPSHRGAWSERITAALQTGDIGGALAFTATALQRWPDDPGFACRHSEALRRAGRFDEARRFLDGLAASHPDMPPILFERAEFHREQSEPQQAEALYLRVLDHHPEHGLARQAAADLAVSRADIDAAIALLSGGTVPGGAPDTNGVSPERLPPGCLLSLIERLIAVDAQTRAIDVARNLAERVGALSDTELARLLHLADRLGQPELVVRVIQTAAERPCLALPLALALVRLALVTEDADLAADLERTLPERVPPALRAEADIEVAFILHGPFSARARLECGRADARLPRQALLIARVLSACGEARIARRYLSFCLRRWPHDAAIRSAFVDACIATAAPEAAMTWLDQQAARVSPVEVEQLRLRLLLAAGDREAALDLVERQIRAGRRFRGSVQQVQLLMSLGRLGEVETAAREARGSAALARQRAAHFATSHEGALLNELRLYRACRPKDTTAPHDAELVEANYHAAREVLDDWVRGGPRRSPPEAATPNPSPTCRILQYWNEPQPPAEIAMVMRNWQGIPGWRYLRLDRSSARVWLAETLGIDYAKAFALARHVAEEADFLRLSLLWHAGGLYADADDLRIGPTEALIADGSRLVVFREAFGALANNVIYAPPRHGAIGIAVRLAREALLRRDNDSVWLKTGPGLLTRAVSSWTLRNPDSAARDVEIRRQVDLHRAVKPHVPLPYKETAGYWNRAVSQISDAAVIAALAKVVVPAQAYVQAPVRAG